MTSSLRIENLVDRHSLRPPASITVASSRNELSSALNAKANEEGRPFDRHLFRRLATVRYGHQDFFSLSEEIKELISDYSSTGLIPTLRLANTLGSLGFFTAMGQLTLRAWSDYLENGPLDTFIAAQIIALNGKTTKTPSSQHRIGDRWDVPNAIEGKKLDRYSQIVSNANPPRGVFSSFQGFDRKLRGASVTFVGPGILADSEVPTDHSDFLVEALGNNQGFWRPSQPNYPPLIGYANKHHSMWLEGNSISTKKHAKKKYELIRPRWRLAGLGPNQFPLRKKSVRFLSQPFISGVPHLVPVVLGDLLQTQVREVRLVGIDWFSKPVSYRPDQRRISSNFQENNYGGFGGFLERTRSLSGHNPIENFLFLKHLVFHPRTVMNDSLRDVYSAGLSAFLQRLESLYGSKGL